MIIYNSVNNRLLLTLLFIIILFFKTLFKKTLARDVRTTAVDWPLIVCLSDLVKKVEKYFIKKRK